jgi:hypothetical protein
MEETSMWRSPRVISAFCFMVLAVANTSKAADLVARSGQTIPVTAVYWIGTGCVSHLNRVVSTDLVTDGEYLRLSLQPQTVRTYQCGNEVPGAWVFATVKNVAQEVDTQLKFIVNYDTTEGPKISAHLYNLKILP